MYKFLLCLSLLALGACGTLDDTVANQDNAKELVELVDKKVDEKLDRLENQGEEVIRDLKAAVDDSAKKATEAAAESSKEVVDHAVEKLEESLPKIIEDSVTRSADKIAERLGAVKKTALSPDGTPVEYWVAGGGGLLGLLGVGVQFLRNYLNSKAGKKRWSEEEVDHLVAARVEEWKRRSQL